jgi:hypothetical protein
MGLCVLLIWIAIGSGVYSREQEKYLWRVRGFESRILEMQNEAAWNVLMLMNEDTNVSSSKSKIEVDARSVEYKRYKMYAAYCRYLSVGRVLESAFYALCI